MNEVLDFKLPAVPLNLKGAKANAPLPISRFPSEGANSTQTDRLHPVPAGRARQVIRDTREGNRILRGACAPCLRGYCRISGPQKHPQDQYRMRGQKGS